jgi:hypothetical protein
MFELSFKLPAATLPTGGHPIVPQDSETKSAVQFHPEALRRGPAQEAFPETKGKSSTRHGPLLERSSNSKHSCRSHFTCISAPYKIHKARGGPINTGK